MAGGRAGGAGPPAPPLRRRRRGPSGGTGSRSRWPTPGTRSPVPAGRPTTYATYSNYYAATPERLFGRQIPVAGGIDVTFREPLGVVGVIVPWNFPMPIAALGFRPGPGRREHGGAEARGTHAADGHPARPSSPRRPGLPAGRLHRHPGPRLRRGAALRRASPGAQDLLHRIDRGGQGDHGGLRGAAEAVHPGAGREERQRDLRRCRSGRRRRPAPRTRCSTTRARTAARGPGSWSRHPRTSASWSCWSRRSRALRVVAPTPGGRRDGAADLGRSAGPGAGLPGRRRRRVRRLALRTVPDSGCRRRWWCPARPGTASGAKRCSDRWSAVLPFATRRRRSPWPTTPSTGCPVRSSLVILVGRCGCRGRSSPGT